MQYDVHRIADDILVVDLQSDLVDCGLRVVAPLVPDRTRQQALPTLEPAIQFDGSAYVLLISEMTSLPARFLGPSLGTLRPYEYAIRRAIDMVFTGI